jgi:predicted MFS family arabinose efflux permease
METGYYRRIVSTQQIKEYFNTGVLALVMSTRMLGLFLILPIFSSLAYQYQGASLPLIGAALGIYGLTQACLQLPFATLSDHIGRKPVIAGGLLLFILGSICAAMSHHIYGVILGRALQGAGAVGSTLLATLADLTRAENRSKMMGMMGLVIGGSFALAMILGPPLGAWIGLSGIFWGMAGLALFGILLLAIAIPEPIQWMQPAQRKVQPVRFLEILKNFQLLRLDLSIFMLHANVTALFVVAPIILTRQMHLLPNQQMRLYLLVLVVAFVGMLPLMIISEKKRKMKPVFITAVALLFCIQILLWHFYSHLWAFAVLLFLFFWIFSFLEAVLPSWISKETPSSKKGAALGVYSTAQFLGIFVGGSLAGWMYSHWGLASVFALCAFFSALWFCFIFSIQHPPYRELHDYREKSKLVTSD